MVNIGIEDDDRELLEEGWAMVQEGITNMIELSSRMLNYAKEFEPEIEKTDLGDLLNSIYQINKENARRKGIGFRLDLEPGLATISCDPRLIHSAVMDLVCNAMDACLRKDYGDTEKPAVILSCNSTEDNQSLSIEVQDNGEGMTEEIKKNIFTPFFSTKKKLGTGVGLTLTSLTFI